MWKKWQCNRFLTGFIRSIFKHMSNTCQTFFAKIVSGWMESTIFAKKSISDIWLGSEFVSDNPGFFSAIITIWGYHFEIYNNLSNLITWLVFYWSISSRNILFRSNEDIFETCQNFTIGNQNGITQVVQGSLLLIWNMLTIV